MQTYKEFNMLVQTEKLLLVTASLKQEPPNIAAIESELQNVIKAITSRAANTIASTILRSGEYPSSNVLNSMIRGALSEHLDELQDKFKDFDLSSYLSGQIFANEAIGASLQEPSQNVINKIRERARQAADAAIERSKGVLMDTLLEAQEEGLGVNEAAKRYQQEVEEATDAEARRIVRTEMNSVQNEAVLDTLKSRNVEYQQWIAAEDFRVRGLNDNDRGNHVILDGQIVRVGDKFSNGLYFPGDMSGGSATIHEWINCRCRLVPFLMPEGYTAPDVPYFQELELIPLTEDAQLEENQIREQAMLSEEELDNIKEEDEQERLIAARDAATLQKVIDDIRILPDDVDDSVKILMLTQTLPIDNLQQQHIFSRDDVEPHSNAIREEMLDKLDNKKSDFRLEEALESLQTYKTIEYRKINDGLRFIDEPGQIELDWVFENTTDFELKNFIFSEEFQELERTMDRDSAEYHDEYRKIIATPLRYDSNNTWETAEIREQEISALHESFLADEIAYDDLPEYIKESVTESQMFDWNTFDIMDETKDAWGEIYNEKMTEKIHSSIVNFAQQHKEEMDILFEEFGTPEYNTEMNHNVSYRGVLLPEITNVLDIGRNRDEVIDLRGTIYKDLAFTSTSFDYKTAQGFIQRRTDEGKEGAMMMIIESDPHVTKQIHVDTLLAGRHNIGEDELLYPPGTEFVVVDQGFVNLQTNFETYPELQTFISVPFVKLRPLEEVL